MKEREQKLVQNLMKLTYAKPYKAGMAIELVTDKQIHYYLEKWAENGWWDYGVSVRSGWFTPEGVEHFLKLFARDILNDLPNQKAKEKFKQEWSS